jgi:hypothetical protein
VAIWVNHVGAAPKHGERRGVRRKRAGVGGSIDAKGTAGDDGCAGFSEPTCDFRGSITASPGGRTRPDQRKQALCRPGKPASVPKEVRRGRDETERCWKPRIVAGNPILSCAIHTVVSRSF